jgi:hypothetical protein
VDGEHAFLSARFASPNLDEGLKIIAGNVRHRRRNLCPKTVTLRPTRISGGGQTLTLTPSVVAPGPANAALREWLRVRRP